MACARFRRRGACIAGLRARSPRRGGTAAGAGFLPAMARGFSCTEFSLPCARRAARRANGMANGAETMSGSHSGACFCGAVQIRVAGQPAGMGYCHCRSCRSWSGGPVNAFTLWPPDAVEVVAGAEHLATYHKTEMTHRKFCRLCGGHLMANHPPLGLVDVFA